MPRFRVCGAQCEIACSSSKKLQLTWGESKLKDAKNTRVKNVTPVYTRMYTLGGLCIP